MCFHEACLYERTIRIRCRKVVRVAINRGGKLLVISISIIISRLITLEIPIMQRDGAPGEIRTPDLLLRRQPLYPAELRARTGMYSLHGEAKWLQRTAANS